MELIEKLEHKIDDVPLPLPPPLRVEIQELFRPPIQPSLPDLTQPLIPLIYNDSMDTSIIQNIMLIDSEMGDSQSFYDNVNSNTFPILYSYHSSKEDLYNVLKQKFSSSIQRISLVFHDKGPNLTASFLDNQLLFQDADLDENQTEFSENVSFLIKCIQEFHVHNIDFLACNTLQYDNWKKYYTILSSKTSVVVGASNNNTGNINYGGDWVMENTSEDIKNMYFNESISNYASTLDSTISADGSTESIYLQMNGSDIAYSIGSSPDTYTNISSWPVTILNTNTSVILNVIFTQSLTISSSSQYFIAGRKYITFDGKYNGTNYIMNIENITGYTGLIQNGTSGANGKIGITVQNIITNVPNVNGVYSSSLADSAGWICASYFGKGTTSGNSISNCSNNGEISAQYAGGIAGYGAGYAGSATFTNCSNTGEISGSNAGGIAGADAGAYNGSATFTSCSNTGVISGNYAGGIAGAGAGVNNGSATFTNCSNTGEISADSAGGIVGGNAGAYNGSATFTNCTNTGVISGPYASGIAGADAGQSAGSATFTTCSNTGEITGNYAGGIAGYGAGYAGSATFTNCSNTGEISGSNAGGIAGADAGYQSGSATFTTCSNTGTITSTAENAGGIAGLFAGQSAGSATFTTCSNTGVISGNYAGGIAGAYAGTNNGSATFTTCTNNGSITGSRAGGIAGGSAGSSNGSATFDTCTNSGAISGTSTGGIAGDWFGFNTNNPCHLINCYNIGEISGSNAGGIVGAEVGYNNDVSYTPQVNITNCYSLGTIANTAGGICGGTEGSTYTNNPVIIITNCYSYGQYTDPNSGIVSVLYTKPVTITNCYSAGETWSDTTAKTLLTGTPTNITTNNPGASWATPGTNIPYILSSQLRKKIY